MKQGRSNNMGRKCFRIAAVGVLAASCVGLAAFNSKSGLEERLNVGPLSFESVAEWFSASAASDAATNYESSPSEFPAATNLVQEPSQRSAYRFEYILPNQSPNLRTHFNVLRAFEEVVHPASRSTVQVLQSGLLCSLGVVVDPDGWIVTKSSEIEDEELECRLFDGSQLDAVVYHRNYDHDLALLKVARNRLTPTPWHPDIEITPGSWLATANTAKVPLAIGVVSVGPRTIRKERAVLGVGLSPDKDGALINRVLPGGGAAKAGLLEGDLIVAIEGEKLPSQDAVLRKIGTFQAGQRIGVGVVRNGRTQTISAQLMDLGPTLLDATEMEVNGQISARSTGFSKAFQHDTVLLPQQCGGPLVDSQGRVIGLNIARAGRVCSYALPADVVIPVIQEMMLIAKSIPVNELKR